MDGPGRPLPLIPPCDWRASTMLRGVISSVEIPRDLVEPQLVSEQHESVPRAVFNEERAYAQNLRAWSLAREGHVSNF